MFDWSLVVLLFVCGVGICSLFLFCIDVFVCVVCDLLGDLICECYECLVFD